MTHGRFTREPSEFGTGKMNSMDALATVNSGHHDPAVMVPHINIQAFCDSQQTVEAIRQAAVDRRMLHAHTTVNTGGIMGAFQALQTQAAPNLLIVESQGPRETILSELAVLAEVCHAETKVVVIGHINDVLLYRELIRLGISDYLVAPIGQIPFIEAIAALYRDPKASPLGRVITFIGTKGGVGSSMIAQNCAWGVANTHNTDTVIADLDLAFGTTGLNFNQDISGNIIDVLGQPDRIDTILAERLLTKVGERLSILGAPGGIDRDFLIEPPMIDSIISALRMSVPCLVLDIPSLWAPWVKFALLHSDQIVITATPELASLRNAKSMIEFLKTGRPNDQPPKLILNQTGIAKRPEISAADFSKALGLAVTQTIPFDPQSFGLAQTNGQTVFEVAPRSKAAQALTGILEQLIGAGKVPVKTAKASNSLLAMISTLRKK